MRFKFHPPSLVRLSVLLTVILTAFVPAHAQSVITTLTGGNWDAGATWVGGIAPGPTATASIGNLTVTLDGSSGAVNLDAGGVLQVGGGGGLAAGLGAASFNFASGTLQVTGAALSTSLPMVLSGSTSAVDTGTFGASLSGVLSGSGSLAKLGASTLTLSGANLYTGATVVNFGTLAAGRVNSFSSKSDVTVASGATLNLESLNETIGSLTGAGNVFLGAVTLTSNGDNSTTSFSGVISGSGGVTKTGTGILNLLVGQLYSGVTSITAGSVQLSGAGGAGVGYSQIAISGSLNRSAFNAVGAVGTFSVVQDGNNLDLTYVNNIPEPSTIALLTGSGVLNFAARRHRGSAH